ncbi:MAG: hypothetical protein ACR2Q4_21035 [Geminicoccaceae bacterium]
MVVALEATRGRHQAFDQNTIDITWERLQEQALLAFHGSDSTKATLYWTKAFDIAERHFSRGDPRLAASRSNQAFSLRRQLKIHEANKLFGLAEQAWDECWCWVPMMEPPCRPDQAEGVRYDEAMQRRFYEIAKRGQAITDTLRWQERLPTGSFEEWQGVKPSAMTDIRKLMAAVFLLVSNKH